MKIFSKKKILTLFLFLLAIYISICAYQTHKPLPDGIDYESAEYFVAADDVDFLYDLTYINKQGEIQYEQEIFDTVFQIVDEAENYILIDMFLFNSYISSQTKAYRNLADELTKKLVDKKQADKNIKIDFITDPINIVYGGAKSELIIKLKNAGINVIISDNKKLRDSNYIYSGIWRMFFQWFGNTDKGGFMKHPFSNTEADVTLRSYLDMLNFKANHRKIIMADKNGELVSLVASANPHDGSSAHSNVAIKVQGEIGKALFFTESGIANLSEASLSDFQYQAREEPKTAKTAGIKIISEEKIKEALLLEINNSKADDKIKIAQFYMADRDILKALLKAAQREVDIKIVMDANKDAFGYKKIGVPNKQFARELINKSNRKIQIRWYQTHGEQFHSKMTVFEQGNKMKVILGSANLTRRNLENYNLELDLLLEVEKNTKVAQEINDYFERIWNNETGEYTLDYDELKDNSWLKVLVYHIQERFGLSSF